MFDKITGEEGNYISFDISAFMQYLIDLSGLFFARLPYSNTLPWFCYTPIPILLILFVVFRKIMDKLLFGAIFCGLLFLVVLHFLYGRNELVIYAPLFTVTVLALLGNTASKIYAGFLLLFLLMLALYNPIGVQNIRMISEFLFRADRGIINQVDEDFALNNEIYQAYLNNDLKLLFIKAKRMPKTFYFGMKNRRKLVFENKLLKDFVTGEVLYSFNSAVNIKVYPEQFAVKFTSAGEQYKIYEDEMGVFVDNTLVPGTGEAITIPNFSQYKYPRIMRVLYQEIMFGIADGKPYTRALLDIKDNRIWYRDAAMVGLFLDSLGEEGLIADYIKSIDTMYDNNHDMNESDNLGQILYLQSLVDKPNHNLIDAIIAEAERIKDENGCLTGQTDYALYPGYQTGWLKFGLEKLGRDDVSALYSNCLGTHYDELLWFTLDERKILTSKRVITAEDYWNNIFHSQKRYTKTPFPYINTAKSHYRMLKSLSALPPYISTAVYPLSWGDDTRPHAWHSIELFLYLADISR